MENEILVERKEDRRKDPFEIPLGLEYCKSPSSSSDDGDSSGYSWSDIDDKNPLHRNLGISGYMKTSPLKLERPLKRPVLMIYDNNDVNANGIMEREGIPPPPPPPPPTSPLPPL